MRNHVSGTIYVRDTINTALYGATQCRVGLGTGFPKHDDRNINTRVRGHHV